MTADLHSEFFAIVHVRYDVHSVPVDESQRESFQILFPPQSSLSDVLVAAHMFAESKQTATPLTKLPNLFIVSEVSAQADQAPSQSNIVYFAPHAKHLLQAAPR